jgi:CRP-like cAMP-binding protein
MSDGNEQVFGQGQTLFRQGEKGGDLFFIKSGKVEISVRDADTSESAVVATMGDKSVLGTMSFLEGEARSATAKALTEVTAIVIGQGQREKLLKTVPAWFAVLVKDLSSSLRRLNLEFTHLKTENVALKKKLAALQKKAGKEEPGAA